MKKTLFFSSGYQIHFETWENDADNYNLKIISGLTKYDVKFYIELANKFRSKSIYKECYGNDGIKQKELEELVNNILIKHPDISQNIKAKFNNPDYFHDELIESMLGTPSEYYNGNYENFCRVIESIKVYYIPVNIFDVSGEFIVE